MSFYDERKLAQLIAGVSDRNRPAHTSPFGGLHNQPYASSLPPVEMPGDRLERLYGPVFPQGSQGYGGPEPSPSFSSPRPMQPRPLPPAAAPPVAPSQLVATQGGNAQGFGGVEPPSGAVYDPNKDPRYLPEFWRGSWNGWQFPT